MVLINSSLVGTLKAAAAVVKAGLSALKAQLSVEIDENLGCFTVFSTSFGVMW